MTFLTVRPSCINRVGSPVYLCSSRFATVALRFYPGSSRFIPVYSGLSNRVAKPDSDKIAKNIKLALSCNEFFKPLSIFESQRGDKIKSENFCLLRRLFLVRDVLKPDVRNLGRSKERASVQGQNNNKKMLSKKGLLLY